MRALIAETYPEEFYNMDERMWRPGGFYRGNPAHKRIWKTESGKAEFTTPTVLSALGLGEAPGRFHLITMRSNDQFNTTIYGHSDRLRGLHGSRMIVLVNHRDMATQGLSEGQVVSLVGDVNDGVTRRIDGLTVTPFDLPDGCIGGYFPEMNALISLGYHEKLSKTPASKGVPVRFVIGVPARTGPGARS